MLQCVAVCCSVLQCAALCCSTDNSPRSLQVSTCCSVLQCVAVCYSTDSSSPSLQVSSVLHCVAVCCSALQWVAVGFPTRFDTATHPNTSVTSCINIDMSMSARHVRTGNNGLHTRYKTLHHTTHTLQDTAPYYRHATRHCTILCGETRERPECVDTLVC